MWRTTNIAEPVLFDLGTLVAVVRVFDRQLVEAEFVLQRGELGRLGILQCDPDEAVRLADVRADFADLDVRELLPVLIRDTVDEHEGATISLRRP